MALLYVLVHDSARINVVFYALRFLGHMRTPFLLYLLTIFVVPLPPISLWCQIVYGTSERVEGGFTFPPIFILRLHKYKWYQQKNK